MASSSLDCHEYNVPSFPKLILGDLQPLHPKQYAKTQEEIKGAFLA